MNKGFLYSLVFVLLVLIMFIANLFIGSVHIPFQQTLYTLLGKISDDSWSFIIFQSRLPQAVTALFSGAALAVCGLMLQTLFKNPLAGPSILGINAGANLGVALVLLFFNGSISAGTLNFTGFVSVLFGAFIGAVVSMLLILFFSTLVKSNVMLLIVGMMLGYITSSVISLLNFFSTAEGVKSYLIWGMGNFGGVSLQQLPVFLLFMIIGLTGAVLLIKPLNTLLLGERYAENLGVNVRSIRYWLLIITGLLTAVTTAFCGPIAFIGLAVPHIARLLLGSSNHRSLLPFTLLCGAFIALLCNLLCVLPKDSGIIPLNAVTPIIGAPIIIYVIIKGKREGLN